MRVRLWATLASQSLVGCTELNQQHRLASDGQQPIILADNIAVSSSKAERLDHFKIRSGIRAIESGLYGNIHSLLIFRRGKLVSESYFPGEDENNHQGKIGLVRHNRDTLHDVRSVSKSVVALAVLIAHERGQIKSLDQPVFDYFPEYARDHAEGAKAKITLRHALTMTAGLDWNEDVPYSHPASSPAQFIAARDSLAFVLSRNLVSTPGAQFKYNGGLTQLLAAVVERATGNDIETFTRDNLLLPLGIRASEWARRRDNKPDADSGLRLRSRDLAKIGLLIANKGRWGRQQLLSRRLVEEAVAPHISIPQEGEAAALGDQQAYGYQIWLPSFLIKKERHQLIELSGNGGQKVLIDETSELMLVVTAGNYDRRGLKKSSIDIYFDVVQPAVLKRKRRIG